MNDPVYGPAVEKRARDDAWKRLEDAAAGPNASQPEQAMPPPLTDAEIEELRGQLRDGETYELFAVKGRVAKRLLATIDSLRASTVTPEMVEAGARALYLAAWDGAPPWEGLDERLKDTWRDEARYVLKAVAALKARGDTP